MSASNASRNGTFPHEARAAAAIYLSRDLAPIPMPTRAKDPGYPDWKHLRVMTETLDHYFQPGYAGNIGVLNGSPSNNALDVDLDCPEARLAAQHLLPPTGWVFGRESAPKSHWIYRTDQSLEKAFEKYTDLDGSVLVELRGDGCLTVYPPSLHKETGEQIEWATFTDAGEVKLADLQRAVSELAAVSLLARHWPSKGTRQDATLALTGGLLNAGWGQESVERFVRALTCANRDEESRKRLQTVALTATKQEQDKKTTGWPTLKPLLGPHGEAVVRRVREWLGMIPSTGAKKTMLSKMVRQLPRYQPFPVEALAEPIHEYVRQGALSLGCDPVYLALPALAVAASAVGNTRTIRLKRNWDEPCIVWSAIVGDSGTLKSPAYLKVVGYLFRLQSQLIQAFKGKSAAYKEDLQAHKDAKKKGMADGTAPGDPPETPVLRRVVVSDVTVEKLAEILEDNQRGTLVARDELAGWLGSFCRYKGTTGGSDLPNWLEMSRAGTVIVDRKTTDRKTLYISRAAVSVTGGIQPGVLARALTPEFLDSGLAARLLLAMPPKLPKYWREDEISPQAEHAYQTTLDRLLALDFDAREEEKVPHVLTLSAEAKDAWVTFYNAWAKEQTTVEGELAAVFSKLEGYAARFALLHHVVNRVARGQDDLVPVGHDSIEAGITLCHWFATEARRIYSTLSESTEERDSRRLVEFIRSKGGTMTARQLQRANDRKYPSRDHAEGALDALVQDGLARWRDPEALPRGGNRSRVLELCPTPDTSDTCSDDEDDPPDGEAPAPDNSGMRPTVAEQGPSLGNAITDGYARTSADRIKADQEQLSELSGCRAGAGASQFVASADVAGGGRAGVEAATVRRSPAWVLVEDRAGLDMVASAIEDTAIIALDLETTGLNPRTDCVRLLSLACDTIDGGTFCYLVDCSKVDPSPLWPHLADKELVLHNAAFDLPFLLRLGFTPAGKVHDTLLLAHLLTAGTLERVNLAACCERWLGLDLDKTEQKSDWSGDLSEEQLTYAALGVDVLRPLLQILAARIKEAGLEEAAAIEHRCLPAIVWMGRNGVAFDRGTWESLAQQANDEADRLREELNSTALKDLDDLVAGWNWDSPPQAQRALTLAGCAVENTADETLATLDHPLAQLLRRYRLASKRGATYGIDWLKHVADDGRVYPGWRQTGTTSGRMSCGEPNMQQLPRGDYRRCVVAPPGRVLVKADYSQIELRIAAKISGDKALLEAYQRGEDLHTRTARAVLGIAEVTNQHRQLAKALNFGLLYGMGANGFQQYAKSQYGLSLTEDEARSYRDEFFRSYPGLAVWHRRVRTTGATETRTLAGRRRLLDDNTQDTQRLNTPIQGTGADGLKIALALLWERREQVPGACVVLAVHDELVVEVDADKGEEAAQWLKQAMLDAMGPLLTPVPVEVKILVGKMWGQQ